MTEQYDELPFTTAEDDWPPAVVIEREPRKCRRHQWSIRAELMSSATGTTEVPPVPNPATCLRCGKPKDEARARRGRQSRNYGNRAELKAARLYGGEKVGAAGGPVDIRGKDWNTQVKTHRRPPPREWISVFAKLEASRERLPRLLLRFVMGAGVPPADYFVVPAKAWLDWFGRDEVAATEPTEREAE